MLAVDEAVLRQSAEAIRTAEGMIILAGAGNSVDSGLPEYRGPEGLWRAYPPLARLGISFEVMANPQWFESDPQLAWGFYGHRLALYRGAVPHKGFELLRQWGAAMEHGSFVFTSNVDGLFQKAGFPEERIVECHGSVHHLQCTKPCCAATWPLPEDLPLGIEEATLLAKGTLPRCRSCGAVARPNVLMFDDRTWSPGRTSAQQVKFRAWQRTLARGRFAVIEIGAGTAVPTVREAAEQLAAAGRVPLIRVNPRDYQGEANVLSLPGSALEVLQAIAAAM